MVPPFPSPALKYTDTDLSPATTLVIVGAVGNPYGTKLSDAADADDNPRPFSDLIFTVYAVPLVNPDIFIIPPDKVVAE